MSEQNPFGDRQKELVTSTEYKKPVSPELQQSVAAMMAEEGGENVKEYISGLSPEKLEKIDKGLDAKGQTWISLVMAEDEKAVIQTLDEYLHADPSKTKEILEKLKDLLQ